MMSKINVINTISNSKHIESAQETMSPLSSMKTPKVQLPFSD